MRYRTIPPVARLIAGSIAYVTIVVVAIWMLGSEAWSFLVIAGLAIFYQSISVAIYAGLFLLAAHIFVVAYEEPTLRRTFGQEYDAYCVRVRRWWPAADR